MLVHHYIVQLSRHSPPKGIHHQGWQVFPLGVKNQLFPWKKIAPTMARQK